MRCFSCRSCGSFNRSASSGWPASTTGISFPAAVSMLASRRISSRISSGSACASSTTSAAISPADCRLRSIDSRPPSRVAFDCCAPAPSSNRAANVSKNSARVSVGLLIRTQATRRHTSESRAARSSVDFPVPASPMRTVIGLAAASPYWRLLQRFPVLHREEQELRVRRQVERGFTKAVVAFIHGNSRSLRNQGERFRRTGQATPAFIAGRYFQRRALRRTALSKPTFTERRMVASTTRPVSSMTISRSPVMCSDLDHLRHFHRQSRQPLIERDRRRNVFVVDGIHARAAGAARRSDGGHAARDGAGSDAGGGRVDACCSAVDRINCRNPSIRTLKSSRPSSVTPSLLCFVNQESCLGQWRLGVGEALAIQRRSRRRGTVRVSTTARAACARR